MKAFSPLLKAKDQEEFIWGEEKWQAFQQIKQMLVEPPILVLPILG